MTMPAPVVLFVYNRPDLTLQTLAALQNNDLAGESLLIVYADGPRANATPEEVNKINQTREVIRRQTWCKQTIIRESATNKGLANSVIFGVSEVLHTHENIIVLEDDLITGNGFLRYMNTALTLYANFEKVMQISGFNFAIKARARNRSYFLPFTTSWGWGTWRRAWKNFDANAEGYKRLQDDEELRYAFNLRGAYPYSDMMTAQMEAKTIDSWAIRWWWTVFKQNGLVLYPDKSLIQNIGFGADATHTQGKGDIHLPIKQSIGYSINMFPEKLAINTSAFKIIQNFISGKAPSILTRLKEKIGIN